GEDLGIALGPLRLKLDGTVLDRFAAALEDVHHIDRGTAARADQHQLHRARGGRRGPRAGHRFEHQLVAASRFADEGPPFHPLDARLHVNSLAGPVLCDDTAIAEWRAGVLRSLPSLGGLVFTDGDRRSRTPEVFAAGAEDDDL